MSINGAVFCAGPYSATWNSLALGVFMGDSEVPTIEESNKAQPLDNTSQYGRTTLTAFHMGYDRFAQFTCAEYVANVLSALFPFGAEGENGIISVDYESLAQALVLTAVTGTPAATAGPATLTAAKAILAPNFNARRLFGAGHRTVPIRMQLFPYMGTGGQSGKVIHYTKT